MESVGSSQPHEQQEHPIERLGPTDMQTVRSAMGSVAIEEESEHQGAFQRLAALRAEKRAEKLRHLTQQEQWRDEFFGNGLSGDAYDDGRQQVIPLKTIKARIEHVATIGKSLASGQITAREAADGIKDRHKVTATRPDAHKRKFRKEIDRLAKKVEKDPVPSDVRLPRPTTRRTGAFELSNSLKIAADNVHEKIQKAADEAEDNRDQQR